MTCPDCEKLLKRVERLEKALDERDKKIAEQDKKIADLERRLALYENAHTPPFQRRRPVIAVGYSMFGLTTLGLALVTSAWQILPPFVLYGVFMGMVEGTQRAYVVDLVAPKLRGTAMGAFHTTRGLALLPASIIAGAGSSSVYGSHLRLLRRSRSRQRC